MHTSRSQDRPASFQPVVPPALTLLLLAVLVATTHGRNALWTDLVLLWEDAARKSPAKARTHEQLGRVCAQSGRTEQAVRAYGTALALDPGFAEAHYNLGHLFLDRGEQDRAMAAYEAAVRLNYGYGFAHYILGSMYLDRGRTDDAVRELRAAVAVAPRSGLAYHKLGTIAAQQGRHDEARLLFDRARAPGPDPAGARRDRDAPGGR